MYDWFTTKLYIIWQKFKFKFNINTIFNLSGKKGKNNKKQENTTINLNRKLFKYFNPVSITWQQSQCRWFGLTTKRLHTFPLNSKKLMRPSTIIKTGEDGNCFYRCLSWWITGSENYHSIIRKDLDKVII